MHAFCLKLVWGGQISALSSSDLKLHRQMDCCVTTTAVW